MEREGRVTGAGVRGSSWGRCEGQQLGQVSALDGAPGGTSD